MSYELTTNLMKPLPSAASPSSTAGNATPWAPSAYVQLSAGLGAAAILAAIIPQFSALTNPTEVEFDIATGAGGSEVVRTTIRGIYSSQGAVTPWTLLPLLDNLPSARIAYRYRKAGTSTLTNSTSLSYFLQAGIGVEVSAQPQKCLPSAADGLTLVPVYDTLVYGTCPWTELTAGLGVDIVATGFVALPVSTISSGRAVIDIATGAAGSEVIVARLSCDVRFGSASAGGVGPQWLPILLDVFPTGTRISVRILPGGSSASANWQFTLQYVEKTL